MGPGKPVLQAWKAMFAGFITEQGDALQRSGWLSEAASRVTGGCVYWGCQHLAWPWRWSWN